jgi:hypothetical protein
MSAPGSIDCMEDFRSSLEAAIDRSESEEELDFKNKVKTYIIESNISDLKYNSLQGAFELIDTSDNSLKILRAKVKNSDFKNFYLDIADKRFWKLYSLQDSSNTSKIIKRLVETNFSRLDYLWLPSIILERYMIDLGKETGFSLKFKNKFDISVDEDKPRDVSMRFWGGGAKKILDSLRSNRPIEQGISLSSIGVNHSVEEGYCNENISNFGKFTLMKGNSIDSHFNIVEKIKRDYSKIINLIETNYRFSIERGNEGLKFSGGPIYIDFTDELEDIEYLINTMFSGKLPFRLSGVTQKESDSFYRIYGIDMHSNDLVNFEITPQWMAIYLNHSSCGNVVTRLVTNMQTYMTSKIKVVGGDDVKII